MGSTQDDYHALAYYTLAHPDPAFQHQYVVDAYCAETADEATKPIAVAFALFGLYLHVEKGLTGREVQRVHMRLAKRRRRWPRFRLPDGRGSITAADVLSATAGRERDARIGEWCTSVWRAWRDSRDQVMELLRENGIEP